MYGQVTPEQAAAEAAEAVEELMESLAKAVTALEEVEGALSDADIDNLELTWKKGGSPTIYSMLDELTLTAAVYEETFTRDLM